MIVGNSEFLDIGDEVERASLCFNRRVEWFDVGREVSESDASRDESVFKTSGRCALYLPSFSEETLLSI